MLKQKFLLIFFILLLIPGLTRAGSGSIRSINLGKDSVQEGDFIGAASTVDLAGSLRGDVMAAGGEVDMSGPVSGDALVAGGTIVLASPVAGSSRLIGGSIEVLGQTGKNLTAAGGSIRLDENSKVGGNVYLAGSNVKLKGTTSGNVLIAGGIVAISGTIGRNVTIVSDLITIADGAVINGSLTYYSRNKAEIAPGAKITGPVEQKMPPQVPADSGAVVGSLIFSFLIWKALSYLLVIFVVWKLWPVGLGALLADFATTPWRKMGTGLIAAIVVPVGVVIALITLVGLPLGLIVAALYAIAAYLGKVLGVLLFGRAIAQALKITVTAERFPFIPYLLGLFILVVISAVPVFGFLINVVIWLWGFGALVAILTGRSPRLQQNVL